MVCDCPCRCACYKSIYRINIVCACVCVCVRAYLFTINRIVYDIDYCVLLQAAQAALGRLSQISARQRDSACAPRSIRSRTGFSQFRIFITHNRCPLRCENQLRACIIHALFILMSAELCQPIHVPIFISDRDRVPPPSAAGHKSHGSGDK